MIFTACLSNLVIHIRDYYWGCNILFIEQQTLECLILKAKAYKSTEPCTSHGEAITRNQPTTIYVYFCNTQQHEVSHFCTGETQEPTTSKCSLKDAMLFKGDGNRKEKLAHSSISYRLCLRAIQIFKSFTPIPNDIFQPFPSCCHLREWTFCEQNPCFNSFR